MEQDPDGIGEDPGREENAPQPPVPPLAPKEADARGIQHAEEHQQPPQHEQQPPQHEQQPPPPSRINRLLHFFNKSEWVMVFLTSVIAATGVVGIILVIQGGKDTARIRDAAETQTCAANKNAQAARDFADTAALINGSIGNAVIKLGQQADDTETFFRTDERAWVGIGQIDKVSYPPDPPFGTTFKFSIYPKNVGKTVANSVRILVEQPMDAGMLMSNERGIRMSQDQLFRESGTNKRHWIPDKPGPQSLAPGEQSIVPVYIGGSEPKRMSTAFWYSYILGRIDYMDAFGVPHWTHFCFVIVNAKGDLGHCDYGNDKDSNPEPAPKPN